MVQICIKFSLWQTVMLDAQTNPNTYEQKKQKK